jgi:hypothetical protein
LTGSGVFTAGFVVLGAIAFLFPGTDNATDLWVVLIPAFYLLLIAAFCVGTRSTGKSLQARAAVPRRWLAILCATLLFPLAAAAPLAIAVSGIESLGGPSAGVGAALSVVVPGVPCAFIVTAVGLTRHIGDRSGSPSTGGPETA